MSKISTAVSKASQACKNDNAKRIIITQHTLDSMINRELREYVNADKDAGFSKHQWQKVNSYSISLANINTQPSVWLSSTIDSFTVTAKEY